MIKTTNNFPSLRADLFGVMRDRYLSGGVEGEMMPLMNSFLRSVKLMAPESEPSPIDGRPGQRIWGKSLRSSFVLSEPENNLDGSAGQTFGVDLDHPSVGSPGGDILQWYIFGTKPHSVFPRPGKQALHFWWGNPLPWPAKDGAPSGPRLYGTTGNSPEMRARGYWARAHVDFISIVAEVFDEQIEDAIDAGITDRFYRRGLDKSDFLVRK